MMGEMELWLHGFAFPGRVADLARSAEEWGFTGLLLADSQNLTADIWVELALAAAATSPVRLGPGVTNPVTGGRTIAAAARHAEGVDLTVGAELEWLRWGVATARGAGSDALTVGAYIKSRSVQTDWRRFEPAALSG